VKRISIHFAEKGGHAAVSTGEERGIIRELGISLGKIVELPGFGRSKILAGSSGLERLVTGVNIMEVPDILNWVNPGQLLVTTGFAIRDNIEAQQNLIPSLAEKGLAGICIKPRRYLGEIPASMLAQADALDFPVIELPPDIGFADLIYEVLSAILHEQSTYLLQMLDVHSALMKIIIDGGGLQKIADTLAMLIGNPVYITDLLNDRQVYNCNQGSAEEVELLLFAAQETRKQDEGLPRLPEDRSVVEIDGKQVDLFIMPLMVASERYGDIYIWKAKQALTGSDIYTIERLSVVAALEIARECSLREVERRYSNEFLNHLLTGRIEDEKLEIEQARKFGWDLEQNYVVGLILPLASQEGGEKHLPGQEIKNRALRELPKRMREKGVRCLAGTKGDYLVMMVAAGEKEFSSKQINDMAKQYLQSELEYLERVFNGWEIRIGLGRFHPGIKGLQHSYQEAKRALRISEHFPGRQGVIPFNDLGLYRFIYAQDRDREVQAYLKETLGKLIEYDREKNTELVRTLQVYFQCHGNLKKVSEALFTHYNTILYRIERIQEISGFTLNSPEDRFNLEVALRLLASGPK
jgi:purine catabolism regulator